MDIKIILVSQEGNAKKAYLAKLKSMGIDVDTVSSFSEVHALLTRNYYNGLMVDLKTKMKAAGKEQEIAREVLEHFPYAQLNYEEETGEVRSLVHGQSAEKGTLEGFINKTCGSFNSRMIRLHSRKEMHFNILLSKSSNYSKENEDKTVTMNISRGGCFLYSVDNWKVGTKVMIAIKELDNKRPIFCEVRRTVFWGKTMTVPGIGVAFVDIDENQLEDLCNKIYVSSVSSSFQ